MRANAHPLASRRHMASAKMWAPGPKAWRKSLISAFFMLFMFVCALGLLPSHAVRRSLSRHGGPCSDSQPFGPDVGPVPDKYPIHVWLRRGHPVCIHRQTTSGRLHRRTSPRPACQARSINVPTRAVFRDFRYRCLLLVYTDGHEPPLPLKRRRGGFWKGVRKESPPRVAFQGTPWYTPLP